MPFVALFVLSKKEGDEVIFDLKRVIFDLKKLIFGLERVNSRLAKN